MIVLKESLDSSLLQMKQFPQYDNQPASTLYHNTKIHSVENILENGILLGKARFSDYEGNGIWTTSTPNQKGYGGCTVAFDSTGYELEKVNNDEFRVWQDIKPEDILFIDFPVLYPQRLSDVPELIKEYGYERTMKVIESHKDFEEISIETIKRLLDR